MTVMLLQRSSTPAQLNQHNNNHNSHNNNNSKNSNNNSQKTTAATADQNRTNNNAPPFLILLDIHQEEDRRSVVDHQTCNTGINIANSGGNNFCGINYGINGGNNNHSYNSATNNNNNNNVNNNNGNDNSTEKPDNKNVAIIGRNSFSGSASGAGAGESQPVPIRRCDQPAYQGSLAMRYYRLWIYACNIVLLGSAVGFVAVVFGSLIFSGDPRRFLVPGVPRVYEPTALYAYLTLAIQLGVVQLLGCIAARRLSERLLNAYWIMLLALLCGDVVIGVAWVFKYEKMKAELKPVLRHRLEEDYGKDQRFTELWDQLQHDFSCCGIDKPRDFGAQMPLSCCVEPYPINDSLRSPTALSAIVTASSTNSTTIATNDGIFPEVNPNSTFFVASSSSSNTTEQRLCPETYVNSCGAYLDSWLSKTADLLFVIGFCVIAFTKLVFLGILRYEIREMIQKIRLLKEPPPPTVPFICPTVPPIGPQPPPPASQLPHHHHHHHRNHHLTEPPLGNNIARRTTLPMVTAHAVFGGGTRSLLLQSEDSPNRHPLLGSHVQPDTGGDSDTNSHCALILEESTPPPTHHSTSRSSDRNSITNNYEMHEFNRRLLLLSNGGAATTTTTTTTTAPGVPSVDPHRGT